MKNTMLAAIGAFALFALSASADDALLAFYAFKDGKAGSSAAGAALVNSAEESSLGGMVELCASDTGAAATYDADAPGVRIYSSRLPDAELLCVSPQSIEISSAVEDTTSARGASITFADAATELSRHHDTGFTVEYFFKMDAETKWMKYGAKVKLPIYNDVSSGSVKTFSLYLPCDDEKTVRSGVGGYSSGKPMYARNANLAPVNDGAWHHVAIVQTPDGYLQVFYDDVRYIHVAVPDSLKRGEVAADSAISLGCNALCAKISCIRMTARALSKDEFMFASRRERTVEDEEVVAFYPFDDGTAGESAAGTNKVRDAVNPLHCPGHVIKATANSPSVVWSSDRPGTYIYAGKRARKPIYTAPGSIHMSSETTGSSGTIKFYGLGKDLSACRDNGHTVEYFLKLDDSNFVAYSQSFSYSAGYCFKGEQSGKAFNLYLPFAMAYANGREFRYSLGAYNGGHSVNRNLPFDVWDGRWHHIAVVESNKVTGGEVGAEITNRSVAVYVDGVNYDSIAFDDIKDSLSTGFFELGNNAHHGKFSCLKVTNRALAPDEFLCATERKRAGIMIIVR